MANQGPKAVLRFPDEVAGKIARCIAIKDAITGNSYFTTPTPTMVDFGTHITALQDAQATVDLGKAGGTGERDAALNIVLIDANHLQDYVQGIADATPEEAEQIIESAGMFIKGKGGKQPQGYKAGSELSGTVKLTTPAFSILRPIVWEISTDNINWTLCRVSRLTECTKSGLTSDQLYYFRYFTIDENNEPTPYSEITSCRVK